MDNFCTAMENTLAHLVFCLNENQLTEAGGLMGLLADHTKLILSVDSHRFVSEKQELKPLLSEIQQKRTVRGREFFMFTMSPSCGKKRPAKSIL